MRELDVLDSKPEILRAARYMRFLVRCAAITLPAAFVWLKFRDIDLTPIATNFTAQLLFKVTLAFYYICWVAGLISDTNDLELVFEAAPDWRHVIGGGTAVGVLIAAVFGLLCYVETAKYFAMVLAVFWAIDILSWLYLTRVVLKQSYVLSDGLFRKSQNFPRLEQLRLVYIEYQCGLWKLARFGLGVFILLVMNWLSHGFRAGGGEIIFATYSMSVELAISMTVFVYVMTMEVWIWFMRLKVKVGLGLLTYIRRTYRLTPVSAAK